MALFTLPLRARTPALRGLAASLPRGLACSMDAPPPPSLRLRAGRRQFCTDETADKKLTRQLSRRSSNVQELFDFIDTNEDGVIDKTEFSSAMTKLGLEELRQLQLSVARNELSGSDSAAAAAAADADEAPSVNFVHRFIITAEVAVSKIFPAGFGWQGASCVADAQFGMPADSMGFALTTGVGDGLGVCIGHTTYYALKKMAVDSTIDMSSQFHTGILLGTAAFCSGTAWQPLVDMLSAAGLSFNQVVLGTWVGCGSAFFGGLRLGRMIYGSMLEGVESNNYGNLKADGALSVAVGGATAAFVGTDVSFADSNWLRPIVGIEEGMSDLSGMATAGASTALGFGVVQTVENIVVPAGKNWVD